MKTIKPDTYTQTKKLLCDWSDKKNYLIHYMMLKFYVRHFMLIKFMKYLHLNKVSGWKSI